MDLHSTGYNDCVLGFACRSCRGNDDRPRRHICAWIAASGDWRCCRACSAWFNCACPGPLLDRIPLHLLQLVIGILLLLFGMRWLRKAILRAAGIAALHDEAISFATETQELRDQARRHEAQLDWLAGLAAFKAILLEGLEVVFIVIAVGAGRGLLGAASIGALAACLVVMTAGLVLHRPLARVPENTLKFAVGVMLSAFGVFWIGEGLGVPWPGEDFAVLGLLPCFFCLPRCR